MLTYIDFSEYNTEDIFNYWEEVWAGGAEWSIVTSNDYSGGKALRKYAESPGRRLLAYTPVGDKVKNCEFLLRGIANSTIVTGEHHYVLVRAGGKEGSENGYRFSVWASHDAPNLRIGKYTDGALTILGEKILNESFVNTWFFMKGKVEGEQLKAKIWKVGEREPEDWDIESVDTSFKYGKLGLGFYARDSGIFDVFSFFVTDDVIPPPTLWVKVNGVYKPSVGVRPL